MQGTHYTDTTIHLLEVLGVMSNFSWESRGEAILIISTL